MIRRRAEPPADGSSSSDEEDAFSLLSRKTNKKVSNKAEKAVCPTSALQDTATELEQTLPVVNTSSMKRHHQMSSSRKLKMDALLQELNANTKPLNSRDRFVPEKKGSFCGADEEMLTTNVFVGNLDPSITEEEVTDLFRQFGDLYSVKIMWPRTAEERSRGRNTGFVCFMVREDAQEAMDAFNGSDPFQVGRRLMLRWGKNVKKSVKRGTGGIVAPIRKKSKSEPSRHLDEEKNGEKIIQATNDDGEHYNIQAESRSNTDLDPNLSNSEQHHISQTTLPKYEPHIHDKDAIRVVVPNDSKRLQFITTVASFVAKDGSVFERGLIERESTNPDFSFLIMDDSNQSKHQESEHIFYRWRVFAFCQGDGFESWRVEPFVMIQPNGRFWIPPLLNREAAWREEQAAKEKEEQIRSRKKRRRLISERNDFMTGRQLEQAKFGGNVTGAIDGGAKLTDDELEEFNVLVKKRLCASREAICEAMAFSLGKSGAAKEISGMLQDVLLESSGISVDTKICRLFLLSDVLYNSQQPGVRNAFLYRDAIEAMAPEVFANLGKFGNGKLGRMTMNKLRTAVGSVLSAWTNWSVYNPTFLDELHARFDGREIVAHEEPNVEIDEESTDEIPLPEEENADSIRVIIDRPRGDWTEVTNDAQEDDDMDGEPMDDEDIDGSKLDESDLDGEPFEEEDVDGECIGADE